MLKKIAIGTANFTQPYGILLSEKKTLDSCLVQSIVRIAEELGIHTFDTAFSYGDFLSVLPKDFSFKNLNVITKFSVLDSYDDVFEKLQYNYDRFGMVYEGLLIHDPQNLHRADVKTLRRFFENVKEKGYVKKSGVSVYDLNEFESFKDIIKLDIIQIPLNPLNQTFLHDDFTHYVTDNNVDVHARSLFLQGVLLSDNLPISLNALKPIIDKFNEISDQYASNLEALLTWANAQHFVKKWILGVASLDHLNELIKCAQGIKSLENEKIYKCFSGLDHPLVDPRNW